MILNRRDDATTIIIATIAFLCTAAPARRLSRLNHRANAETITMSTPKIEPGGL
jgi:hypothetical protein